MRIFHNPKILTFGVFFRIFSIFPGFARKKKAGTGFPRFSDYGSGRAPLGTPFVTVLAQASGRAALGTPFVTVSAQGGPPLAFRS